MLRDGKEIDPKNETTTKQHQMSLFYLEPADDFSLTCKNADGEFRGEDKKASHDERRMKRLQRDVKRQAFE